MNFKSLILVAFAAFTFSLQNADACSMAPFDPYAREASLSDLLQAVAVDKTVGSADHLDVGVELIEADGGYIWNNPMCPEGEWVSATYRVVTRSTDPRAINRTQCLSEVTVTRRKARAVSRGMGGVTIPAVYELSAVSTPARCTR